VFPIYLERPRNSTWGHRYIHKYNNAAAQWTSVTSSPWQGYPFHYSTSNPVGLVDNVVFGYFNFKFFQRKIGVLITRSSCLFYILLRSLANIFCSASTTIWAKSKTKSFRFFTENKYTKKINHFLRYVVDYAGKWVSIPEGSFKTSRNFVTLLLLGLIVSFFFAIDFWN